MTGLVGCTTLLLTSGVAEGLGAEHTMVDGLLVLRSAPVACARCASSPSASSGAARTSAASTTLRHHPGGHHRLPAARGAVGRTPSRRRPAQRSACLRRPGPGHHAPGRPARGLHRHAPRLPGQRARRCSGCTSSRRARGSGERGTTSPSTTRLRALREQAARPWGSTWSRSSKRAARAEFRYPPRSAARCAGATSCSPLIRERGVRRLLHRRLRRPEQGGGPPPRASPASWPRSSTSAGPTG